MRNNSATVLKGNIVYAKSKDELCIHEAAYLVCQDGKAGGVFKELPEKYSGAQLVDYGDKLIVPGFCDIHTHAPQYAFRAIGTDMQLLEWLDTHTFPEEAKYKALEYAQKAYSMFVQELKKGVTTRVAVFATVHMQATLNLMQQLEESGLAGYVGKVNMDRNCPDSLCEDTDKSLADTREFFEKAKVFKNIKPIITPRFTPTCSDKLLQELGKIRGENNASMQTHLSENKAEIEWVASLCPNQSCYADTYFEAGLLQPGVNSILAHCVLPSEGDLYRLRQAGAFVAHCPLSNTNLSSGIAPVRQMLELGIKVGLGSDVAGGHSLSMLRVTADAIAMSKLYWTLCDNSKKPLTVCEAFYLATKGGGEFFGKVGSFEDGYAFDAVVLSDDGLPHPQELSIKDRLERLIYLADDRSVTAKYVNGNKV